MFKITELEVIGMERKLGYITFELKMDFETDNEDLKKIKEGYNTRASWGDDLVEERLKFNGKASVKFSTVETEWKDSKTGDLEWFWLYINRTGEFGEKPEWVHGIFERNGELKGDDLHEALCTISRNKDIVREMKKVFKEAKISKELEDTFDDRIKEALENGKMDGMESLPNLTKKTVVDFSTLLTVQEPKKEDFEYFVEFYDAKGIYDMYVRGFEQGVFSALLEKKAKFEYKADLSWFGSKIVEENGYIREYKGNYIFMTTRSKRKFNYVDLREASGSTVQVLKATIL